LCLGAVVHRAVAESPVQLEDGTLEPREKGSPQGSVVSPLLSNLFLHYAFDRWMAKHHPDIPFERFADDVLCHCGSERQARELKESLARRFAECGLELHPDKTRIVYCKDDDRRGDYPYHDSNAARNTRSNTATSRKPAPPAKPSPRKTPQACQLSNRH